MKFISSVAFFRSLKVCLSGSFHGKEAGLVAQKKSSKKKGTNSGKLGPRNWDDLAYVKVATKKVLKLIVGDSSIHSITERMSGFSYTQTRDLIRRPGKSCNPTVMFLTDFANATGYTAEEMFQMVGKAIDEEKEIERKEEEKKTETSK